MMELLGVNQISHIPILLHDYIFSGGILKGGSWGGKECRDIISLESHSIELIVWFLICSIIFKLCGHKEIYREMVFKADSILRNHRRTSLSQTLDVMFAVLHFGIWFLVLYYKITLHSLINLCQPCHIALFVQGVGVLTGGAKGAILGILSLPLVIGPIGALIVPALDGLDQPYEELFFFIQHYLLLITPLFLLLRNNYCAYKLVTFKSFLFANWAILVLHWFVFAPVNRHFEVNVNFMLCPSEGMSRSFAVLPSWLLWPSYRTLIVGAFFLLSFPICYFYMGLCAVIIFLNECIGGTQNNETKNGHFKCTKAAGELYEDNRYRLTKEK